ncbi:MAG TPA: DUF4382 domain-containing protein [Steroidobacteraceae bacterium]|nr:DUF4382 domain-containing protein [Steroidobacteraceae bacterium]
MNALHLARRCLNGARQFSHCLLAVGGLSCALLLNACSGGAGTTSGMNSPPPPSSTNGTAMVTLTDQPGDFLSYMVNVVSLTLTRSDGTVVQTVPATTTVDFAQLVNLSEVLTAQQVPSGSYSSVSLTLDYSTANIVVDNGAGGLTVPAANIINGATMAPLVSPNSQMTVTLQLPAEDPLVVTNGTIANLALDFNLTASDTVAPATITSSTAASAVTVTVNPVLVASLTPDTTKQIRVRGPLVSVTNTSTQTSYTVTVWPFFTAAGNMGQFVVYTTSTTAFTLNGTSYTGNAGLTALAALPAGTLTAAYGTFDTTSNTFTAAEVFAGSSVPGAGLDSIEGTVTARSGDTLTVSNTFLWPHAGADVTGGQVTAQAMGAGSMGGGGFGFGHWHGQVTVTVAATTTVTEDGQTASFGPPDISVGQHVQAFGTFAANAAQSPTLDATSGSVRLMITPLWGQFTSAASGVVTLNLETLDELPPAAFNFAGTGTSSAEDAMASAYTVGVPAALTIPALTAGFPIAFTGFVTPFGSAAGSAPPDFAALTLVNFSATAGRLHLYWVPQAAAAMSPPPTAPFVAPLSATNVVMTQATVQSAAVHVVRIGPATFDPGSVSAGLSFVPSTSAPFMFFAIGHRSSWQFQTYSTFGDFITALSGDLNGTTALLGVDAQGPYDETTGVMTVNVLAVALSD